MADEIRFRDHIAAGVPTFKTKKIIAEPTIHPHDRRAHAAVPRGFERHSHVTR